MLGQDVSISLPNLFGLERKHCLLVEWCQPCIIA